MIKKSIKIYYDGFCPYCTQYTKLQRLREEFDVHLIDLREAPEEVDRFIDQGINLDKGMVVKKDENLFWGNEAVFLLASLQNKSLLGYFWRLLFLSSNLTKIIYPVLVFLRNLTLRILNRPKIHHSRDQ